MQPLGEMKVREGKQEGSVDPKGSQPDSDDERGPDARGSTTDVVLGCSAVRCIASVSYEKRRI